MKFGFVGAGAVGQMHLQHWSKIQQCEIVALADLRPQLCKLVASKFQIPTIYDSHTELLKDPDIEAVIVVTRRHNTAAVVHDCLSAGKHVFSEKPMAKTWGQAKMLSALARAKGVHYTVGYQRRHDAGTQIAKRAFDNMLQTGELGRVVFARSWNFTGQDRDTAGESIMTEEQRPVGPTLDQTPDWLPVRFHEAYDRFVNVFVHDINLLRYFFNNSPEIRYINLDRKQGHVGVFEFDSFISAFEGGLNELNNWEERGKWDEGLEIFFEKGRLRIELSPPLIHDLSSRVEVTRGNSKERLSDGTGHTPAFELQAAHFIDDILSDRQSLCSGHDSREDLAFVESLWKSYLSDRASAHLAPSKPT